MNRTPDRYTVHRAADNVMVGSVEAASADEAVYRLAGGDYGRTDYRARLAAPVEVGATLGNGTTVLLVRPHRSGGYVVLCSTNGRAGHRFATWRCTRPDDTSWGHYFDDLAEANADYRTR